MSPSVKDGALWLGIALVASGLATAAPLEIAGAGVIVLGLLAVRGRRALFLLALLGVALGYGRAASSMRVFETARAAAVEAGGWPSRCTFVGTVVGSPALIGGGYRVVIDPSELQCEGARVSALRIAVHLDALEGAPARGDRVAGAASLAPPYLFANEGAPDPRPPAARRGVLLSGGAEDLVVVDRGSGPRAWVDRVRSRLRARIVATFPPDTAPMARALVLGEDDLLEADSRAFRRSGLAHLLAVSGMHLVLVVMGLVALARALLVRLEPLAARADTMRIAATIGIPCAWLYADLAGGSGSATRAAWMCTIVLLARVLGRNAEPWRALGLSLVAMWIVDPLAAFDVSFVLSALATAGLLGLARPLEERLGRLPRWLARPLATTAAATIACAPVLARIAPELALGGLFANIVAVPLGEAAALPLCLLHGLLEPWPDAERGCAIAASGALVMVRLIAHSFTWGTVAVPAPTTPQLTILAIVAAASALGRPRRWLAGGAVAIVALELFARVRGAPHGVLRATFIDVGQGDAALVDLPDGSAMLIDGGGLVGSPIDVGDRAVGAVLMARRRTQLAAVVLSHPHPDHFLGLASALARVRPGAFWDTGQGEEEGSGGPYASLLGDLRSRGVPVLRPPELCGTRTIGGATVEVLAPCPRPAPDRGANDNSFVIRIRYGARALLFVGDAEHTEEAELADLDLRADVLKVGHHGSRTSSTPAFLARVQPRAAVISCGIRNRFGHPHASTLAHLGEAGIRVFRTDEEGSVLVTTDGTSLEVRSQLRSTTPM